MNLVKRNLWVIVAVVLLLALFATLQVAAAPSHQTATPTPPEAQLELAAWPANSRLTSNVITGTFKGMTDTKVGPVTMKVAMGTTGMENVPVSFPVVLDATSADAAAKVVTYTWAIVGKPAASKLALPKDANMATLQLIPDVAGAYMVSVRLSYADKTQSPEPAFVKFHAATFVGDAAKNCAGCHPGKTAEWLKTGHANIFKDEIDNTRTPNVPTHYAETCIVCHTVGYFTAPYTATGGIKDQMTKAKWAFPTFAQIDKGGNWAAMPAAVKAMGNIQCENCHGPASEHIAGKGTPSVTMDDGVCNVCHNGGGHHNKGDMLKNAGHSDATSAAFTTPVGPTEQACVRCHTSGGYKTFLEDPKNPAAWDNTAGTVGCSTCHDPHSDKNAWQLRIAGTPVEVPFEAKNVGLSATCYECHNGRTPAANAVKSSFPHYSSVAEMISDTAGVTYGKTAPNSPHGMMVGTQPIANPAAAADPTVAKWLFTPTAAKAGEIPGACVTCHMWPVETDTKSPTYLQVGGHTFNTVAPNGKGDYGAACKSCHGDVTDFNLKAKADYDGNGKVEGVQDEMKGALNVLWGALEKAGVKKQASGYPYATLPKDAKGQTDDKIDNAWFNYRVVYGVMWGAETGDGNQGKAQAIHNFKRSMWLLQQSYKDLTGTDMPKATLVQ